MTTMTTMLMLTMMMMMTMVLTVITISPGYDFKMQPVEEFGSWRTRQLFAAAVPRSPGHLTKYRCCIRRRLFGLMARMNSLVGTSRSDGVTEKLPLSVSPITTTSHYEMRLNNVTERRKREWNLR